MRHSKVQLESVNRTRLAIPHPKDAPQHPGVALFLRQRIHPVTFGARQYGDQFRMSFDTPQEKPLRQESWPASISRRLRNGCQYR